MQISIKPAAVTYLKDHVNQDQRLFLALDDGQANIPNLAVLVPLEINIS